MALHSRSAFKSQDNTQYQPHSENRVNHVHHSVCRASSDVNYLNFKPPRRRPDNYDVPITSQSLLKLDASVMSSRLKTRLCSASRVYCGDNILNIHIGMYAKHRPKSVLYRWSPPDVILALPKIQRAKTAGLVRVDSNVEDNDGTKPRHQWNKAEGRLTRLDKKCQSRPQKKSTKTKAKGGKHSKSKHDVEQCAEDGEKGGKENVRADGAEDRKHGEEDRDTITEDRKHGEEDRDTIKEDRENDEGDSENDEGNREKALEGRFKEYTANDTDSIGEDPSENEKENGKGNEKKQRKRTQEKKDQENRKTYPGETVESDNEQGWLKSTRGSNSDDDYSSDDDDTSHDCQYYQL